MALFIYFMGRNQTEFMFQIAAHIKEVTNFEFSTPIDEFRACITVLVPRPFMLLISRSKSRI